MTPTDKKKVVLAGGSGFLGRSLAAHLSAQFEVVVLSRGTPDIPHARVVTWDARNLGEWTTELENAAALINLAGRSVNCRYNETNKRLMMDSRTLSTRALGQALAACSQPPPVWINSSTATIYKHTLGPAHGEDGEIGSTPEVKDEFAIDIATAWEREFFEAPVPGVRRVAQRTAMVMANEPETVFDVLSGLCRKGLGGRQGSGDQYVSWLHIEDYCLVTEWMIRNPEVSGVYNVCAPNPVTNREMMAAFRKSVGISIGLPASRWMLEIGALFMRTETELILKSRRVIPARLLDEGYAFLYTDFSRAVEELAANES